MNLINDEIKSELSIDEELLWSGQPKQGVIFRNSDMLAIPFSLMWGGFAIFWESSVLTTNAPWFFKLWGIPFVLVGLYMIFGRFFFDAKQRSKSFYAVTSQRIIIVNGVFNRAVKSMNLKTLADTSFFETKNNEGTIIFGTASPFSAMLSGFSGWPGAAAQMAPQFDSIQNAKQVYEIIQKAQRSA
jgi:Bacterial PH domain